MPSDISSQLAALHELGRGCAPPCSAPRRPADPRPSHLARTPGRPRPRRFAGRSPPSPRRSTPPPAGLTAAGQRARPLRPRRRPAARRSGCCSARLRARPRSDQLRAGDSPLRPAPVQRGTRAAPSAGMNHEATTAAGRQEHHVTAHSAPPDHSSQTKRPRCSQPVPPSAGRHCPAAPRLRCRNRAC